MPDPIIDIHQHTNYANRSDVELLRHQRHMGVTQTILLPAGSPSDTPATMKGKANGLFAGAGGQVAERQGADGGEWLGPDLRQTFERLSRMRCQDPVQIGTKAQNLPCLKVDVCSLALKSAHPWLVNQNSGVRKRKSFLVRACRQKHSRHAGGLSYADGAHVVLDELHRIVNRQARRDRSAGAVDVQRNIAVRVFGFEEQQLGNDQIRNVVVNRRADEDDAVAKQPRINVVGAFASVRLFNNHRNQGHVFLSEINKGST